jgi:hypothetical protein
VYPAGTETAAREGETEGVAEAVRDGEAEGLAVVGGWVPTADGEPLLVPSGRNRAAAAMAAAATTVMALPSSSERRRLRRRVSLLLSPRCAGVEAAPGSAAL